MTTFEIVTEAVNRRFAALTNGQTIKAAEHSFAVANIAGILAMKRGADVTLCKCAGMLHDIWLYESIPVSPEDHRLHGEHGAREARALLENLNILPQNDIDAICMAIALHDEKDAVHSLVDEILKDADAFAHFVRGSEYDKTYRYEGRPAKILSELGIRAFG